MVDFLFTFCSFSLAFSALFSLYRYTVHTSFVSILKICFCLLYSTGSHRPRPAHRPGRRLHHPRGHRARHCALLHLHHLLQDDLLGNHLWSAARTLPAPCPPLSLRTRLLLRILFYSLHHHQGGKGQDKGGQQKQQAAEVADRFVLPVGGRG